MVNSMTGFAQRGGAAEGAAWLWEMRGVNGRGLDLRLRLPEGFGRLEAPLRAAVAARLARGSVTLSLRLDRARAGVPALDASALDAALAALARVRARAEAQGMVLAPVSPAEVLGLRGVWDGTEVASDAANDAANDAAAAALDAALMAGLGPLLDAFIAMRAAEGGELAALIAARLDRIEELSAAARTAAGAREAGARAALAAALERLAAAAPPVDEGRLAQELALIAVRGDVAEELDRLIAHVAAARALLAGGGAIGRRLDFLVQEFLREANTLCAKSQDRGLTAIGLDLKATIEQMREQAANVE